MNKTTAAVKTSTASRSAETVQAGVEVSRGMQIAFSATGGLIGIWSAACVIGGLVASGGPLSFVKSYFTAVTGM